MQYSQKAFSIEEARKRMERYCSYQERSHQEVLQKLKDMRMIPEATDLIMAQLIEKGYLNEERFAKAFCQGKFSAKSWGRNRIRYELRKRNVSKYNINSALKELEAGEYLDKFNKLAERRWSQLSGEANLQRRKKKLADYLLYRGWESDLVYDKAAELSKK